MRSARAGGMILLALVLFLSQELYLNRDRTVLAQTLEPIVVTAFGDDHSPGDGVCTLREAIIAANRDKASNNADCSANIGPDVILLAPGVYTLTRTNAGGEDAALTGDLDFTSDITLRRHGEGIVIIRGDDSFTDRIFHILSGDVTIDGVTIRDGNIAGQGGGIYNAGTLELINSTLTGNTSTGEGGGLFNDGQATLLNVTVAANSAPIASGLANGAGALALVNTLIVGDSCTGTVGALDSAEASNLAFNESGCSTISRTEGNSETQVLSVDGIPAIFALKSTSLAVDALNPDVMPNSAAACPAEDQRGVARPQLAYCDIGSYEWLPQAPTGNPDGYATDEDAPLHVLASDGVLANDDDPDSATLTAYVVTMPAHAADFVFGVDGSFSYTPTLNYFGPDEFQYSPSDGSSGLYTTTVSITVFPVDDAPITVGDAYSVDEDETLSVAAPGVLVNDSDIDDLVLTALPLSGPVHAADFVLNADGSFSYTPLANYFGPDEFQYSPNDGSPGSYTTTVSITVNPVNDAPVAVADVFTVAEDDVLTVAVPGVLANDGDDENAELAAVLVTSPLSGSLALDLSGAFVYTPTRHFEGVDRFAYRASDGSNSSPATVTITVTPDIWLEVINTCDTGYGSLRWALSHANADQDVNTIIVDVLDESCGTDTIVLESELPEITESVIISASFAGGSLILDGSRLGPTANGLTLRAGNSVVDDLVIRNFGGSAIVLRQNGNNTLTNNTLENNGGDGITIIGDGSDEASLIAGGGNTIRENTISGNDGNGITIVDSVNNLISDNSFFDNVGLDIDLGNDGPTPNDKYDGDNGANFFQNKPILIRSTPGTDRVFVDGWLNSKPGGDYTIDLYGGVTCGAGQSRLPVVNPLVTTDEAGTVYFSLEVTTAFALNTFIRATATDRGGNTSEYSDCVVVTYDNDAWPKALEGSQQEGIAAASAETVYRQRLTKFGESRWYKIRIAPGSRVVAVLSELTENYDLTIYRDIPTTLSSLLIPEDDGDLLLLGAEFAPDAFSPDAFSPDAFSPDAFSPDAFSPDAFSPDAFSPDAFSPDAFSPDAFSPDAFSPDAFSPDAFSPDAFSPDAFSPDAFSPDAFSPDAFSPDAFASAQLRSLLAVSAQSGTSSERVAVDTWNETGHFYLRVRGREGVFDPLNDYKLTVDVESLLCGLPEELDALLAGLPPVKPAVVAGAHETLILVDTARLPELLGSSAYEKLHDLASATGGLIVDVGQDPRVSAANQLADANPDCPFLKNVVAESIRAIVQAYQAGASSTALKYLVLVGSDDVIPFFRHPDQSLLAPEFNYVPPVRNTTTSYASLAYNYVLGQDAYGASTQVAISSTELPIPYLAVGRLVETPSEIATVLDAYLATGGVVTPATSLVTGYDFLADAAEAVRDEFALGLSAEPETLITPSDVSPLAATLDDEPPGSVWTANNLRAALLANDYDMVFLAGHFSANSALAADYRTRLLSSELFDAPVDFANNIIFSPGCHSGYNIVTEHGIPQVTREPDWAQAFAAKGATLIAGTGYQYGDTDFIEYSELLYLLLVQQLRTGSEPVSIGQALAQAKQSYLVRTPDLRGLHRKALLQATLFGLPMLQVNWPGQRITPVDEPSSIPDSLAVVGSEPGASLRLQTHDLTITSSLTPVQGPLANVEDGSQVTASYLTGSDGIAVNPVEPVLPMETADVSVPGLALRGAGLRNATYGDEACVLPLTGAPATEMRGLHGPFAASFFYPVRLWQINAFDALSGNGAGRTLLQVKAAQHRASEPGTCTSGGTSTRREFADLTFRLYYSNHLGDDSGLPVQAAPPSIVRVEAVLVDQSGDGIDDAVMFQMVVVGNPAAGIQEAWVTYTATEGPWYGRWQSLNLTQDTDDSSLWTGVLALAGSPQNVRFIGQAVNGVGLVALATNLGAYYVPGGSALSATSLTLEPPTATSGAYGTTATFRARLTGMDGAGLADQIVTFGLGSQRRNAVSEEDGWATVDMPLLGRPGTYLVTASFDGTPVLASSSASTVGDSALFAITPQSTALALYLPDEAGDVVTVILTDGTNRRLFEQTIFYEVSSASGTSTTTEITDLVGEVAIGPLPAGAQSVRVWFQGTASFLPSAAGPIAIGQSEVPTNDDEVDQPVEPTRILLPAISR